MGDRLGLHGHELDDLEMAALLHHVGQVTLDDPEVAGRPEPHHVAAVTSSMLREIRPLAGAGDIVAGDSDDGGRRLAVQVLRLASEYDELTVVDGAPPKVAFETLRTAPRYIYDERVLQRARARSRRQHQRRRLSHRLDGHRHGRCRGCRRRGLGEGREVDRSGIPGRAVGRRGRACRRRLRLAWKVTSQRPTAMMRSPKLIAASNGARSTMMSPRNISRSSLSCGWCLIVGSTQDLASQSGGTSTGMPRFTVIAVALQATPMRTMAMPRSSRLRAQNAAMQT